MVRKSRVLLSLLSSIRVLLVWVRSVPSPDSQLWLGCRCWPLSLWPCNILSKLASKVCLAFLRDFIRIGRHIPKYSWMQINDQPTPAYRSMPPHRANITYNHMVLVMVTFAKWLLSHLGKLFNLHSTNVITEMYFISSNTKSSFW